MPTQKGILKVDGTFGDITFYKSKYGNLVKEKTSTSAASIKANPNFDRFRENQSEFGRAGIAAKLVRHQINLYLRKAKDRTLTSRLTTEMLKVVKSDPVSDRGMRKVMLGNLTPLVGFDFNDNARLTTSILVQPSAKIDRVSGELAVSFPALIPAHTITAPVGATNFKIVSAGLEIDFDNESAISDHQESAEMPLDTNLSPAITQVNTVTPNSSAPLLLIVGIQFSEYVNGKYYPFNNGSFNALSLIAVNQA